MLLFLGVPLITCVLFIPLLSHQWRAPEEYKDAPLTEKIDVWSLGNNLYSLLTGLDPLYEIKTGRKFEVRSP